MSPLKLRIPELLALKLGALALVFVGSACLAYVAVYGDTFVSRYWSKYTNYIDKTLRLLFLEGSSKKIVKWQGALIGAVVVLEIGFVEIFARVARIGPQELDRHATRIASTRLDFLGFLTDIAHERGKAASQSRSSGLVCHVGVSRTRHQRLSTILLLVRNCGAVFLSGLKRPAA